MKYLSTRGGMSPSNFSTILLEGLAPDGGLTIPTQYPQYNWQNNNKDYCDFAKDILSLYAPEIAKDELSAITKSVYSTNNFTASDIIPLNFLDDNTSILDLSNGPTFAFKDVAMQLLGELFARQLKLENRSLNILGATSGDTGSAAQYAMRGRKNIRVFMLSPFGRMSDFQRAQMYSLDDDNIHNLSVHGVFDSCQNIVKELSQDLEFKKSACLGAVNSINWGRICAQVVYYFYGYAKAVAHGWDNTKISFVVPTGNFGNVLAGHVARQMGLPINRLIVATNENNVLEQCIKTGIYKPRSEKDVFETSSPSMDIAAASNFERYVFDLCERDPQKLNVLWQKLAKQGFIDFKAEGLFDKISNRAKYPSLALSAGASNHQQRIEAIKYVWDNHKRLIDPHTADAFVSTKAMREEGEKIIVLETAKPIKFSQTITEAVGEQKQLLDQSRELLQTKQKFTELNTSAKLVREYIEKHI